MPRYPGLGSLSQVDGSLNEYFDGAHTIGYLGFDGGRYPVNALLFGGELHVIFVEPQYSPGAGSGGADLWVGRGPICKKWNGSSWVLVGTDMEPTLVLGSMLAGGGMPYYGGVLTAASLTAGDRLGPSRPQLCTDGTTLYCAYAMRVGADSPDAEGTWDAHTVVVKYFDGSDWVLVTEIAAETYNTWYGTGLDAGAIAYFGTVISIGATPDDPGNVYLSWYEEGPQSGIFGFNAHNWRQRWHCQGYSTAGSLIFDHDIYAADYAGGYGPPVGNPDNAFDAGTIGRYADFSHRFARGNGTLYLMYASLATGQALDMLDVLADAVTTVSEDALDISDLAAIEVTATAEPFVRTADGEMTYFGSLIAGSGLFPAQVHSDASGEVEQLHGLSPFVGGIVDGIHPVDDKNVILVFWQPPHFSDPDYIEPAIFHDNCGPAISPGDTSITDITRLSSQYDADVLLLYIATMKTADGQVVAFETDYLPDEFFCGGIPAASRVFPV